jgi:hypothetical protein
MRPITHEKATNELREFRDKCGAPNDPKGA